MKILRSDWQKQKGMLINDFCELLSISRLKVWVRNSIRSKRHRYGESSDFKVPVSVSTQTVMGISITVSSKWGFKCCAWTNREFAATVRDLIPVGSGETVITICKLLSTKE